MEQRERVIEYEVTVRFRFYMLLPDVYSSQSHGTKLVVAVREAISPSLDGFAKAQSYHMITKPEIKAVLVSDE